MTTIWFTSDTHFGHKNVCELTKRPFASVEAHDEALITNWNELVKPEDTVYHLGDFGLARRRKRLNGDICLVLGNHDSEAERPGLRELFHFQKDAYFFKQRVPEREDKVRIHLCHYPFVSWCESCHGAWHLHGHCHGELPDNPCLLRVDVGVDCFEYRPISLARVVAIMEERIRRGAGPNMQHLPGAGSL